MPKLGSNKDLKEQARRAYHNAWRKHSKSSSTPGSKKGGFCVASRMDRFFAKYSRARKHTGYFAWCESHKGKR